MPLIAIAVCAYVAGLLAGFGSLDLPAFALAAAVGAGAALRRSAPAGACALLLGVGVLVARDAQRRDEDCSIAATRASEWTAAIDDDASPGALVRARIRLDGCAVSASLAVVSGTARAGSVVRFTGDLARGPRALQARGVRIVSARPGSALAQWRATAGARIDSLFGEHAPLVRALLIADTRSVSPEIRDRFAAAGLVHILSISGLHVAIVAEAVALFLQLLRFGKGTARWGAVVLTAMYVAAIGAPAPAVRSAAMLGASTLGLAMQRPTSPWATLAIGAALPLADPTTATDLGWQLSVTGFAALTAAQVWTRRLPEELRGWKRSLARDLAVSTLASVATAPLVAWAFGRVSLVAPLSNLVAGPIVGLLQPMLFLALAVAPAHAVAQLVADAADPLLRALDGAAGVAAAMPGASISVAPTLAVATAAGVCSLGLIMAAASRREPVRGLLVAVASASVMAWWPAVPTAAGTVEVHMIDVGQGDAIGVRTPAGRWLLFDAGRSWRGGDAGRTTVIPYLRRFGGDLALFVLSHPHADHVGGAATVLHALHPDAFRDAAFAGQSQPYRAALDVARQDRVPWVRVHPGDSLDIDGVVIRFLAPDSAWTARLHDPNLASTVAIVRFGDVRILFTGDAEGPEEDWLLAHDPAALRADVLKVGHHGSRTSSTPEFLAAVGPRIALVSVGAGNTYGHPSPSVMEALANRGALVLRTDRLGSIVVRTDGHTLRVDAHGQTWLPDPVREP